MLLALVEKGLGRDEAYEIVQRESMRAWDRHEDFRELVAANPTVTSRLSPTELQGLFDYSYYVRYVDEIFQRVGLA